MEYYIAILMLILYYDGRKDILCFLWDGNFVRGTEYMGGNSLCTVTIYYNKNKTIDFFIWARNMKIFVFPVNVHQSMISAEEYFNNQVDKKICSVYSRQILSPATFVITLWAHEKSGKSGRNGFYANLSMPTAACPVCQEQRPKLSPHI